jgi:hypothetical protein
VLRRTVQLGDGDFGAATATRYGGWEARRGAGQGLGLPRPPGRHGGRQVLFGPSANFAPFLEAHDRLATRYCDLSVNDRAFRDSDAARDDVSSNDGRGTDLELLFNDQLSENSSGNHRSLRVNLAFPLRFRSHAQSSADAPVATDGAQNDERTAGLDIARKVASFGYESGGHAKLIDQTALRCFTHLDNPSTRATRVFLK